MSFRDKQLYEFGDFRLDVDERLLLQKDRRVRLADKAFDTLSVLVKRHGHLVSKDELISQVWPDTAVEDNNLDKSISAIRRTLGDQSRKARFIETVRGRGYRFIADVSSPQASKNETVVSSQQSNGNVTTRTRS